MPTVLTVAVAFVQQLADSGVMAVRTDDLTCAVPDIRWLAEKSRSTLNPLDRF